MPLYAFLGMISWMSCAAYSLPFQKLEPLKLHSDSFYLVCRGTVQKKWFIADVFNVKDKNSTHIGVGIYERGNLMIYNVSNVSEEKSDLIIEKLTTFANVSDIYALSIWEYKSSKQELLRLKKILQSYTSKKIIFDTDFEDKNEKLYCSEFCALVLKRLNPKAFHFPLSQKKLDHLYRIALHREVLVYYPVDFFQSNNHFQKIYEKLY